MTNAQPDKEEGSQQFSMTEGGMQRTNKPVQTSSGIFRKQGLVGEGKREEATTKEKSRVAALRNFASETRAQTGQIRTAGTEEAKKLESGTLFSDQAQTVASPEEFAGQYIDLPASEGGGRIDFKEIATLSPEAAKALIDMYIEKFKGRESGEVVAELEKFKADLEASRAGVEGQTLAAREERANVDPYSQSGVRRLAALRQQARMGRTGELGAIEDSQKAEEEFGTEKDSALRRISGLIGDSEEEDLYGGSVGKRAEALGKIISDNSQFGSEQRTALEGRRDTYGDIDDSVKSMVAKISASTAKLKTLGVNVKGIGEPDGDLTDGDQSTGLYAKLNQHNAAKDKAKAASTIVSTARDEIKDIVPLAIQEADQEVERQRSAVNEGQANEMAGLFDGAAGVLMSNPYSPYQGSYAPSALHMSGIDKNIYRDPAKLAEYYDNQIAQGGEIDFKAGNLILTYPNGQTQIWTHYLRDMYTNYKNNNSPERLQALRKETIPRTLKANFNQNETLRNFVDEIDFNNYTNIDTPVELENSIAGVTQNLAQSSYDTLQKEADSFVKEGRSPEQQLQGIANLVDQMNGVEGSGTQATSGTYSTAATSLANKQSAREQILSKIVNGTPLSAEEQTILEQLQGEL